MFEPEDHVLAGISGGPDSMALLHFLLLIKEDYKLKIGVAHFNHSLRAEDSDADEQFVKKNAEKHDLPFYFAKQDVKKYKEKQGLSLEEAARILRYDFFNRIAKKYNYKKIALGHNKDDNAELVLMYLLRGS